jgi:hypothetical protein
VARIALGPAAAAEQEVAALVDDLWQRMQRVAGSPPCLAPSKAN